MRFAKEVLASTVAEATLLVFEMWTTGSKKKAGIHYGSFIIAPSERQYYDIPRTDIRPHFQILDRQVDAYIESLQCQGFEEVEDASRKRLRHNKRPSKFFVFLESDRNHFLPEVTVINDFLPGSSMRSISKTIPMTEIAQRMFVDEYEDIGNDIRGNLRYDIGYTAVNQTDEKVVDGMFFPKRLTKCSKIQGIGRYETMEKALFAYGCGVMRMADEVSYMDPFGTSGPCFSEVRRDYYFGIKWCRDLGLESLIPWARFDASSCFGTGVTVDHRIIKTENHVDKHNSRAKNHWNCPTYTELVNVRTKTGCVIRVRVGINIYKKACCDDVMNRLSVNEKIEGLIKKDLEARNVGLGGSELYKNFIPKRKHGRILNEWTHEADDNKDGHYSMYVNVLNELGAKCGRNRAVLIEALMTIPFTPASDGWYHNFRVLLEKLKVDGQNSMNLIELYIELSKKRHGTVSWGQFPRCRVSHHGKVTVRQLYHSAKNLDYILELANMDKHETKYLVKKMSSSVKNGGVHGVGPFYAQVILNVATKIGLVNNHTHIGKVSISSSTATYKRLKKLGVKSPNHAAEIVPYLCSKLGISQHVCENMICELLRRKYGKCGTKDYYVRGHCLCIVDGGKVWRVDRRGRRSELVYAKATYNNRYCPRICWWQASVVFDKKDHEWDNTVVMLKKRKMD